MSADQYPLFLGFLAIQVLAVFRMHDDDLWTKRAYWGRLGKLVNHTGRSNMPLGLTSKTHQKLWRRGLEYWANVIQQERWGTVWLPADDEKADRHVKLPKSQALLSMADLEKLPTLFNRAGFRPREHLDLDIIRKHVVSFQHEHNMFGSHARRVLADERLEQACEQVKEYLQKWEGGATTQKASLWLQLLFYDPPELRGGLSTSVRLLEELLGRTTHEYKPFYKDYLFSALDPMSETWYEQRKVKPGEDVLLLIRSKELKNQTLNMHRVAESGIKCYNPGKLRGLPLGWCALHFKLREDLPADTPDWIFFDPLQPIGGLRVGRNRWMAGAGPTIMVRSKDVDIVEIDSCAYPVLDHRITPTQAPCLDEPGLHRIRIVGKPIRNTIEVIEIDRHTDQPSMLGWEQEGEQWPAPEWLPTGPSEATVTKKGKGITIRGPVILGEPARQISKYPSIQRQWLEYAMRIRGVMPIIADAKQEFYKHLEHPLLRQLSVASGRVKSFPRR